MLSKLPLKDTNADFYAIAVNDVFRHTLVMEVQQGSTQVMAQDIKLPR